jgi:thymidylate synthase ThyX
MSPADTIELVAYEPPPRPTIHLPPPPEHGPVVLPIDWSAGDRLIARYFWTSTDKDEDAMTCEEREVARVINFGMKANPVPHGTPTGHGHLTVLADRIPLPIAEQMLRHRVQVQSPDGDALGVPLWVEFSANISKKSLRYVDAGDYDEVGEVCHIVWPADWRTQTGRPGHYAFETVEYAVGNEMTEILEESYAQSLAAYRRLRDLGASMEQARFALPTGTLTRMYATTSWRNWLNWLVQRNDSHAQGEIQQVARQVEAIVQQCIPLTFSLWESYGRRVV